MTKRQLKDHFENLIGDLVEQDINHWEYKYIPGCMIVNFTNINIDSLSIEYNRVLMYFKLKWNVIYTIEYDDSLPITTQLDLSYTWSANNSSNNYNLNELTKVLLYRLQL